MNRDPGLSIEFDGKSVPCPCTLLAEIKVLGETGTYGFFTPIEPIPDHDVIVMRVTYYPEPAPDGCDYTIDQVESDERLNVVMTAYERHLEKASSPDDKFTFWADGEMIQASRLSDRGEVNSDLVPSFRLKVDGRSIISPMVQVIDAPDDAPCRVLFITEVVGDVERTTTFVEVPFNESIVSSVIFVSGVPMIVSPDHPAYVICPLPRGKRLATGVTVHRVSESFARSSLPRSIRLGDIWRGKRWTITVATDHGPDLRLVGAND